MTDGSKPVAALHPADVVRLGEIVRRALREELSLVQAELVDLRASLVARADSQPCTPPPPTDHAGGSAPLRSARRLELPGMLTEKLPQQAVPRPVGEPQHLFSGSNCGDVCEKRWRQEGQQPQRLSAPRLSARAQRRQSQVSCSAEVLNVEAVKTKAEGVKYRQDTIRRNSRTSRTSRHGVPVQAWTRESPLRSMVSQAASLLERSKLACREGFTLADVRRFALEGVQSPSFDILVLFALMTNAVFIGLQANQNASKQDPPAHYSMADMMFCAFFAGELALRIFAYGGEFFKFGEWWNYFDLALVMLQMGEEITAASLGPRNQSMLQNLSGMRILRILRLLRVLRVLRVIKFVGELKKVVYLIFGSLPSFFWTLVLLSLMIYVLAVFFTQLVADSPPPIDEGGSEHWEALKERFGSTMTSALTLYKTVSGGVDWEEISTPIMEYISPPVAAIFVLYSLFAVLVLLNLVTGVFVDGAMRLSRADLELDLFEKACKLLDRVDVDQTGDISWAEFEAKLESSEMLHFFEALEISMSRAGDLFQIIDTNSNGALSLEELVAGSLMLQGPAKAIDVAALSKYMHEVMDVVLDDLEAIFEKVERLNPRP